MLRVVCGVGVLTSMMLAFACSSDGDDSGSGGGGQAGSAAGGTGNSGGGGTAGSGAQGGAVVIQCAEKPPKFPAFDKNCSDASDCVVVAHQIDCCGTEVAQGISKSEQAGFDAAEKTCRGQFPTCQCAPQALTTDEGQTAKSISEVQVKCRGSVCTSFAP